VKGLSRGVDFREACVVEALAVVAESGVHSLSLREVARRLGVSHQAPYKHFASRDHILAEIVRRAFDHFAAALDARPRSLDLVKDSRSMGRAYVDYALEHPLEYQLMFGAPLPPPERHPEMMRSARHAFSLLRDDLARVFAASGAPEGAIDLDSEALFVWAAVHGLASLQATEAMGTLDLPPGTRERMREHMLDRIGAALGVAPPALSPQPRGSPE
jgi:AcrR family transcriptional regulator